jgi:hypothetical protein
MDFIDYPTLFQFILDNYSNSNMNNENKNRRLFNVLHRISEELNKLQEICGFIHGDLHAANILLKYNSDEDIKIIFIDFGYSVVQLPLYNQNNNKRYLLSSNEPFNLKSLLDLYQYPKLKSIDLFHLFRDLYIFMYPSESNNENNKIINLRENISFRKFINGLFNLLKFGIINNKNLTNRPHIFSRKNTFNVSNELIPLNFINLNFNNIISSNSVIKTKTNNLRRETISNKTVVNNSPNVSSRRGLGFSNNTPLSSPNLSSRRGLGFSNNTHPSSPNIGTKRLKINNSNSNNNNNNVQKVKNPRQNNI